MAPILKYPLSVFFILWLGGLQAAVCTSVASGSWTNGSTWSCGAAPACGDSIVILAGHTVSITAADFSGCGLKMTVVLKGTLKFTAFGKLELPCLGRMYVYSGGQILAAPGAVGNDNAVMQCGSTWWNAGAGTYNGPGCLPPSVPGCASLLPVELVTFEGHSCGNGALCLTWQTATEINNDYFELQRSEDGISFHALQRVGRKEITGGMRKYEATDPIPFEGINYYRLRQVDLSGQSKIFRIIALVPGESQPVTFTISPNPNEGSFTLRTGGLKPMQPVQLQIMDNLGQSVRQLQITREYNSSDIIIKTGLSTGIYFCTFSYDGGSQFQRLVVSQQ